MLLVCAVAGFWLDSLQKRDVAVAAGRAAAERLGLQLLDETVAFASLGLQREAGGRLRLRRRYRFEVSDTGANRLPCSLTLLGSRLLAVEIPPYRDNVVPIEAAPRRFY